MIKFIKRAIIIFMVVAVPLYSSPAENDLASFLAGIIVLKSNSTLTPEQKAQKFNELKKITGVES
ncbi:MAG: hypothetical protein Q4F84_08875, partial [Fibrobacter sp.]|nr:hypothetical protein [Fibrobacter sp.]